MKSYSCFLCGRGGLVVPGKTIAPDEFCSVCISYSGKEKYPLPRARFLVRLCILCFDCHSPAEVVERLAAIRLEEGQPIIAGPL